MVRNKYFDDRRPMTLRRQVSLVLPFVQPVGPDQQPALILDAWLCATAFRRISFYRQSGNRGLFSFRSITLRRRVSPVLLFIGAILLLHFFESISIQQLF
jgi:hypothetical protein